MAVASIEVGIFLPTVDIYFIYNFHFCMVGEFCFDKLVVVALDLYSCGRRKMKGQYSDPFNPIYVLLFGILLLLLIYLDSTLNECRGATALMGLFGF